jgi:SAM-dependent methyltransferase
MNQVDAINHQTWAQPGALNWLGNISGFTDAGERAACLHIADEVRDQPILDIGIGGGRTIPILLALSKQYVGIDYQPEMVARTHGRFPAVDIQVGDARDLSRFASNSFSLVVFSYAGIDAVDRDGRAHILREAHRVLRKNGIFWFSTLNKDGGAPHDRPWTPHWPKKQTGAGRLRNTIARLRALKEIPICTYNYARLRKLRAEGDGWLVAPFAAHSFGLVVHYTTLADQQHELEKVGFSSQLEVFDPDGNVLQGSEDLHTIDFFNILCRK